MDRLTDEQIARALAEGQPVSVTAVPWERGISELGREREALADRQQGLELLAKVPHRRHTPTWLLAGLATSERKLGMKVEAFRHAQQAIGLCTEELDRTMPFICAPTHFIYPQVLLDRGDRDGARRQAALAREGHRTPTPAACVTRWMPGRARSTWICWPPMIDRSEI